MNVAASDFLDAVPSKLNKSNKSFHKLDLDKDETVNDGKGSKYRTTTKDSSTTEALITTTTVTPTTQTPAVTTESRTTEAPSTFNPRVKTTTTRVPLDDHITEKFKSTTNKPASSIPTHYDGHLFGWVLGKFFSSFYLLFFCFSCHGSFNEKYFQQKYFK